MRIREKIEEFVVKSLLPSLLQREESPLFGIFVLSLDRQRGAGGDFRKMVSSQLWTH
jgi:hypothetical protein